MRKSLPQLVFALALLGAGCAHVDPVIPVEEKRMVVVPMRDPLYHYFECPRGMKLAELVSERLRAEHDVNDIAVEAVSYDELVYALREVDPKDLSWADIGRKVKADYVLVGNILRFETKLKGDVGFVRGAAIVDLTVVETAHPEKPLYKKTVKATFPPEGYRGWGGYSGEEGDEEQIETGLYVLLTKRISELFFEHEPEKDE